MSDDTFLPSALSAVLPLRDIVIFPHMIVPLFVGRKRSVNALEYVMKNDRNIFLVTQKDIDEDNPDESGLYATGTIASVLQLLRLPDGTVKVLIEGHARGEIKSILPDKHFIPSTNENANDNDNDDAFDFLKASVTELHEAECEQSISVALRRSILEEFRKYCKLSKKIPADTISTISQIDSISRIIDVIASHIDIKIAERQSILDILDIEERCELLFKLLNYEISILQIEKKIEGRVKKQMDKTQKEYYLNERIRAIQQELGGSSGSSPDDINELEKTLSSLKLPSHVKEKADSELKKLRSMTPMSAESAIVRNYLDCIISLPWTKKTKLKKNIAKAEEILDKDHYSLLRVKEHILEFLAVQKRNSRMTGPILCFVGPPGVGKTSLARSIATATGREFIRNSMGGVKDEAEIRGHRRTYVGAMPGKIIQSMQKSKTINPLILLDEIDKMGHDFRGDPSSAMLEVLDPEQNKSFVDNYVDVGYDLSNVMFVATANTLDMPTPLIDRMEIVHISGYTEEEKLEIARAHLIKKLMRTNSVRDNEIDINSDVIIDIIRFYTRESGVRDLNRKISKICRKAVYLLERDKVKHIDINTSSLKDFLGTRKYRFGIAEDTDLIGVTTGLAWTAMGGDLLTIEAAKVIGKGRVKATGKLGDVMKESVEAAFSYIKSNMSSLNLRNDDVAPYDFHIHVPEGAIPKDGPSAGITIVTSLVSLISAVPVKRTIAMTGEVTLMGKVLPIGGLKEKLLAALRGGLKTVIIPKDNVKDLEDVPKNVLDEIEIIPASNVSDVLKIALSGDISQCADNSEEISVVKSPSVDGDDSSLHISNIQH